MIIASWNCNMAFRKKAAQILKIKPDILVVQECEHPDRLLYANLACEPTQQLWFGENQTKGLGIFSYSDFRFELHDHYNPAFKYVVPIRVTGSLEFILLAVWAMDDKVNRRDRYIGQVWNAINYYSKEIDGNTVLIGDLNSNKIWDLEKPMKSGNHSDVVRHLNEKRMESAYHFYFKEEQGKESKSTLFLHRKIHKPYHIDYCFLSQKFLNTLDEVTIGSFTDWIAYSDHMPIYVTLSTI
jgi:exodeoxyribonuclease III